ncbi:MAG: RNA methyltransferase [Dongiaceae bacterium]
MSKPIIILVRPQLAENIGMVARAMLNCGLDELRLVTPDYSPTHEKAMAASVKASSVLEKAEIFDDLPSAIRDCQHVYATSARRHDMVKPVFTPHQAIQNLHRHGEKTAILFGPERAGLENEDLSYADSLINIPLNPDFTSLNLAQAVLLVAYEWFRAKGVEIADPLPLGSTRPAAKEELHNFFNRLEEELDKVGFLYPPHKREKMVQNIRHMWQRAGLTLQELNTLHGIVTSLRDGNRHRPKRKPEPLKKAPKKAV